LVPAIDLDSATFTAYQADIQPATKERTEMFSGRFGQYYGVCGYGCRREGNDQIVVTSTGKKFSVRGVQDWSVLASLTTGSLCFVAQDA